PDRRGLAQPSRPQFQADQRRERALRRPAGRTAPPDRLGERARLRQPVAGRGGDHGGNPALDQREQRLQAGQRGLLLGSVLRPDPKALTPAGSSAAVPAGPSGRPTSVELTTSSASAPTAAPAWPPTIIPPILRIMSPRPSSAPRPPVIADMAARMSGGRSALS